MDFLGGALPNVMFIVGMLAIGLGLGIELKLVPLNKEIDKTGRIGAMVVGAILVAGSIFIYLNPAIAKRDPTTSANILANAAAIAPATVAVATAGAASAPQATAPGAAAPQVKVPDLHGLSEKDIKRRLEDSGLVVGRKLDTCTGPDQGDSKTKKGRVLCQNPPSGASVRPGTAVNYALAEK